MSRARGLTAVQEVFALWGICFGAIVLTHVLIQPYDKLVATVGFLYLPLWSMRRRQEEYRDYGVSFRNFKEDLKWFSILLAIVAPLFIAGYVAFAELLLHLPPWASKLLSPYTSTWQFNFRLPDRFFEWVIDQLFVVALPEEFFYRGFIQRRLRDAWPKGRLFFGARIGPAFWLTQALFAVGHLAIFRTFRLGVFFPALLFGWMREKTGSVLGAALLHAVFNLLVLVLEASFYGRL